MDGIVCQELVELVTDYLDGVLPDADVEAIRLHLAGCDDCTTYVTQMEVTAGLAEGLREAPPDEVVAVLLEAFRRR